MPIVRGGRTTYGEAIGILMLDTRFPRIPGDIGNATTFPFPVRFKVVTGASPKRVVLANDPALLEPFMAAAQELEREGVRAITTSCGYLIFHQQALADAVSIPVFTSSLLQVPAVHRMIGRRRIGILTANGETLSERHLKAAGIEGIPLAIAGSQDRPAFYGTFVGNSLELDVEAAEQAVVGMAKELAAAHPDLGAFVCEGTNFASFGPAVQEATGLPFFDIITLTHWVYAGVVKRRVAGGFL